MRPLYREIFQTVGCFAVALFGSSALILGFGNAEAAPCNLADLAGNPAACNQTIGDQVFSDFSFSSFSANSSTFNLVSGSVSLDVSPDATASVAGSFTYKVTLLNGRKFLLAQSNISGSTLGGGSYSTSLSSSGLPLPATSTSGAGLPVSFNSGLTSQVFTQTFNFSYNNSPDTLQNLGASFTTTAAVPGPVPVLGASLAFGFSRKLRKRIKSTCFSQN